MISLSWMETSGNLDKVGNLPQITLQESSGGLDYKSATLVPPFLDNHETSGGETMRGQIARGEKGKKQPRLEKRHLSQVSGWGGGVCVDNSLEGREGQRTPVLKNRTIPREGEGMCGESTGPCFKQCT